LLYEQNRNTITDSLTVLRHVIYDKKSRLFFANIIILLCGGHVNKYKAEYKNGCRKSQNCCAGSLFIIKQVCQKATIVIFAK